MLTAPLTDLSMRYPPVTDVHLMFKTMKEAVNINYWWIPHA
jgi:hypothetical protein